MLAATPQYAIRVGTFYGALFLVYGISLPYLSVLLDARGLSATEIGLVSSFPLLLRLGLTPAFAIHADRHARHRVVIIALALLAMAAILVVVGTRGFWSLFFSVAAFHVGIQSTMPLAETIAMSGVRRFGLDYGRMRLAGSVTFIVATFVGAWVIDWRGTDAIAWMLVAAAALTVAASVTLPAGERIETTPERQRLHVGPVLNLMATKPVLLFLLATGAVQSAHAVVYAFGVLQWRRTGIEPSAIGILWSIGVIAEIGLFWWSAQVLARWSAVELIRLGAAAAVVRWTLMAFDPPLLALVPLQALHGLTYGASHLGAMHYIKANIAESQAGTAQALYSTVTAGIGMGLAMIVAGQTYAAFAGRAYLAMALLSVVALIAAELLLRSLRTKPTGA